MKYLLLFLLLIGCELEFTPYHEGLPKTGEWRTNLAVGDVNNDGFLDLAAIGRKANAGVWLQNNGSWKLSVQGIPQTMQCGVGVSLGDVNNDGNLDVAFGQHCGGPIVYLGDGKGNWKNHSAGLTKENVDAIALADLDDDGLLDIVTLRSSLEGYIIYKNKNVWEKTNTTLPEITANSYQIVTEDINNDGKIDIISTGGKIHVFLNKGNFTFEDKTLPEEAFYTFVAANKEYIAANSPTQLLIYKNYELYRNISCGRGGVAFADINNDEETDLIASCGKIRTFLGPTFEEIKNNIPPVNGTPYGLIAQDINKNKKTDIIAAFNGGLYAWVQ